MKKILIAICLMFSLAACPKPKGEVHILPEGYRGAVVILFNIKGCPQIERDRRGYFIFPIGHDGMLITSDPPVPEGYYDFEFYYGANGTRTRIPSELDTLKPSSKDDVQVFAYGNVGNIKPGGGVGGEDVRSDFKEYCVGVPGEIENCSKLLEAAADRAISRALQGGC